MYELILMIVWNLHQSVADWFDKTDYVQRYSPFGVMQQMQGVNQMNALMNPGGDITALGTWVCTRCSSGCTGADGSTSTARRSGHRDWVKRTFNEHTIVHIGAAFFYPWRVMD